MGAAALLAATFNAQTPLVDRVDDQAYNAALARRVASVEDIAADYEWQQLLVLPISPPDPEIPLAMPGGTLPLDPHGFSEAFLGGLIPAMRNGVVVYPVTVYEDPLTQARVILNAAGKELARVAAPGDYDPLWYVEAHTPSLAVMEPAQADWYAGVYDPSRIEIAYDLILEDALVQQVWQMSLLSEIPPPPDEECEDCEGEGTNAPLADWSGVVSNLQFVQIVRLESGLVVRVTLGIPDWLTNDVSVFTCTNLVAPAWSHLFTTNAPTMTNTIIFTDDNFTTNNKVRFYNAMSFAGTLHPQAGDFESGKAGRVMISTLHDDHYYTATPTTKADEPAQTEDAKVTITTHLPTSFAGKTVFFRVVSPDPDDLSPYEADTDGGDNRDTNIVAGVLSASNDVAELETINGQEVAAAEVELTITDRYAGDNYQVEYSLDSDFARVLDQTVVMVAWKRIYIEEDQMYRSGSDLAADFVPDTNSLPDSVTVTEISKIGGLTIGETVVIFDADKPAGESAIVTNIAGSTLFLDTDLTNSYVTGYGASGKGAAVALPRAGVFDASTASLTNAFGETTDGTDGGCFVEFAAPESGCNLVPYKSALNVGFIYPDYSRVWFANGGKANYIHLIGANTYLWANGKADESINLCIICVGWIEAWQSQPALVNADVTVHEMGHQFSLAQTDSSHPDVWCHLGAGTDYCVMDYDRNRSDATIEFCVEDPNHIYAIRDRSADL